MPARALQSVSVRLLPTKTNEVAVCQCVTAHCMCVPMILRQPLLSQEAGLEEAGETTRRAESAVICDVSLPRCLPARSRPTSLRAWRHLWNDHSLTGNPKLGNAAFNLHDSRDTTTQTGVLAGTLNPAVCRSTAINGASPPARSGSAVKSCITRRSISWPGCPGLSTVVSAAAGKCRRQFISKKQRDFKRLQWCLD